MKMKHDWYRVRVVIAIVTALMLSACAEFLEGMDRGTRMQTEYRERRAIEADPFLAELQDMPQHPQPVGEFPGREFYRCTDGKRTLDYAFHDGEFYSKGWRQGAWYVMGCNKGKLRTSS